MKKILVLLLLLCGTFGIYFTTNLHTKAAESDYAVEMRGVWVATVANMDFKIKQSSTNESAILKWKTYFLDILDRVEELNMNAIFFQVRPNNDAFYDSEYNAWSSYLMGYGQPAGWDPLTWMVDECHARGIEFHAWLNPYRIGTLVDENININLSSQEELNAAKLNYSNTLKSTMKQNVNNPLFNTSNLDEFNNNILVAKDGNNNLLCLNPASESVINHIVNTVKELVNNYDIDGIHYDDYFYPAGGIEKGTETANYNAYLKDGGTLNLADWKRDNVDRMVKQVSDAVREHNKTTDNIRKVAFGISPSAVWATLGGENCSTYGKDGMNVPCGSYSSYANLFADTKKWVEEEWLDYILPQVYYSINNNYKIITEWWANVVSKTNVKLYIGTGLYNAVGSSPSFSATEVYNQMKWVRQTENVKANVDGYVFFSYQSFNTASNSVLIFVRQYFKTGALTPVIYPIDGGSEEVGYASGDIKCIAQTSNYQIIITETPKAKGYLLFEFSGNEALSFDQNHLVAVYSQTTGSAKHIYLTEDLENKVYIIKTYNRNNDMVSSTKEIDTKNAISNEAPVISFKNFVTSEYYLMNQKVEITVNVTDDTTSNPMVTLYHATDGETFRNGVPMNKVSEGVYTYTWEAFGISEEDTARIKVVATDGDKTSEVITDYFKVYEKEPVQKYTVTFKDQNGQIIKEENVEKGKSASAPTPPTVDGYTFDKWDRDFTNINNDITVTAIYTKNVEKKGCKKDMLNIVISLISIATIGTMILKKER